MGGLVFKKVLLFFRCVESVVEANISSFFQAYLDAQLDARYATIIRSVKSVVFLSTPHRGSDLAAFLNRVLSLGFGPSPKQYIADLNEQGSFLRTINEQFRHVSNDLQIFSFYETLQTSLGVSSAVLYPPTDHPFHTD